MSWSIALATALICTLLGCSLGSELKADPAWWSPPLSPASEGDAAHADEDASTVDPACATGMLPAVDPALRTSTATAVSHLAGVGCLEGCHAAGGEARTAFVAAGTVYRSQTSRQPAGASGSVHGVGGTTLPIDLCGNFYLTASALQQPSVELTQPFVQNPTVHRMEKPLIHQANPGSCNQLGCHDFRGKLTWGIYN